MGKSAKTTLKKPSKKATAKKAQPKKTGKMIKKTLNKLAPRKNLTATKMRQFSA